MATPMINDLHLLLYDEVENLNAVLKENGSKDVFSVDVSHKGATIYLKRAGQPIETVHQNPMVLDASLFVLSVRLGVSLMTKDLDSGELPY